MSHRLKQVCNIDSARSTRIFKIVPPALTSTQIHATLADEQVRKGDRSAFGVVNVIHELLRLDEDQYVFPSSHHFALTCLQTGA